MNVQILCTTKRFYRNARTSRIWLSVFWCALLLNEITVVSSGGKLTVNGLHLPVGFSNRRAFELTHQYLLFLRYRSSTNSYVKDYLDGFDISASPVTALRTTGVHPGQETFNNPSVFLRNIHASVNRAVEGGLD